MRKKILKKKFERIDKLERMVQNMSIMQMLIGNHTLM